MHCDMMRPNYNTLWLIFRIFVPNLFFLKLYKSPTFALIFEVHVCMSFFCKPFFLKNLRIFIALDKILNRFLGPHDQKTSHSATFRIFKHSVAQLEKDVTFELFNRELAPRFQSLLCCFRMLKFFAASSIFSSNLAVSLYNLESNSTVKACNSDQKYT